MNLETLNQLEAYWQKRSKENFWIYRQYINANLKIGWFQKEIAYALQDFYKDFLAGKRPKLILQTPPQHGKSQTIIDFISWIAGVSPNTRVIYGSFSERLGIRANLKLQKIYDSNKFQNTFGIRINTSNVVRKSGQYLRNREILEYTNHEGYFRNTTVGGAVTGESLDLGILDDIIKGREQADSKVYRDKIFDWLTDDFMTRFSEYAGLIAIITEWHHDSPIQRLIAKDKSIKVLKYKAIAEEDEKYRKTGEALFPELKSAEFLLDRKRLMPVRSWESLFQQNVSIKDGNIFKMSKFRYYKQDDTYYYLGEQKIPKSECRIYQTIDPAGTENPDSDYFGGLTYASYKNYIIVLDIFKEQALTTKHKTIMQTLNSKWNPVYQGVESKMFGLNIIQTAKDEGVPVKELKADKNKIYRAEPLEVHFENELVWFHNSLGELEKELLEFPNGKHDDLVDCLAYAVILNNEKEFHFVGIEANGDNEYDPL